MRQRFALYFKQTTYIFGRNQQPVMEIWIFEYKIVPWSASSEDQIDEELKSEILTAAASVSAVAAAAPRNR